MVSPHPFFLIWHVSYRFYYRSAITFACSQNILHIRYQIKMFWGENWNLEQAGHASYIWDNEAYSSNWNIEQLNACYEAYLNALSMKQMCMLNIKFIKARHQFYLWLDCAAEGKKDPAQSKFAKNCCASTVCQSKACLLQTLNTLHTESRTLNHLCSLGKACQQWSSTAQLSEIGHGNNMHSWYSHQSMVKWTKAMW